MTRYLEPGLACEQNVSLQLAWPDHCISGKSQPDHLLRAASLGLSFSPSPPASPSVSGDSKHSLSLGSGRTLTLAKSLNVKPSGKISHFDNGPFL